MAERRTRGMTGSDHSRSTAARATAIAETLHHECCILLELYRKKERFTVEESVADRRLVSVPPPSSQLDTRDTLWRLHSALLQCRSLLDRAIAKEEQELGGGKKGDYETQRKMVRERLSLLLINTGELLKAVDGTAVLTPNLDGLELEGPSILFELKLWIYRIYKEVEHWTKTAITTLQGLPSVTDKERARGARLRSMRSARR
ncbi:ciliary neurotrophic factor [Hippoglossus hippoglossus]|uniref:ciliary neurotrophic factor n=1 Tax=Hippoglossus hippoglossus TaxID=8267 RepID=UPI00148CEA7E|nr:ciliary neurotrophic factor [Hippoglossus hippoglossus]XP_035031746.1 ciliary neurotrophic factor [Hippoglossus stenolepis]